MLILTCLFGLLLVHPLCTEALVATRGPLAPTGVYLNPGTGRFWTMDSYEGDELDPRSLHKYLYCRADPINRIDPSGLRPYYLWIGYSGGDLNDPQTVANSFMFWAWGFPALDGYVHVTIKPSDNIYEKVKSTLDNYKLVVGTDTIESIDIAGHGSSGHLGWVGDNADITLQSLEAKEPTPQKQFLAYLKPYTQSKCTVTLRACEQAKDDSGKKMMSLIAEGLGATVVGWDDWYAGWGRGNRWTVDSTGNWTMKKGRPWEGTLSHGLYTGKIWENLAVPGLPISPLGGYSF